MHYSFDIETYWQRPTARNPPQSASCERHYAAPYPVARPGAAAPLTFPTVDAPGDQCLAGAAPAAAWSPAKSLCVRVWR